MKEPQESGFKISEVIIIVLITCTFSIMAGISYGKIKYSETISIGKLDEETESNELSEFIKQYKNIISNYYDSSKLDEEKLLDIALEAIVKEVGTDDPHALYMTEEDYGDFNIVLAGQYEGLGIGSSKVSLDDYASISYIIDDSPASKANLKVGDILLSIDGKSTKEMTVKELSQYIIDSEDKDFLLKVKRGEETFNVNITKGNVELKSVASHVIEQDGKKIGYMGVSIFASNTYLQFEKALEELEKQDIDTLIIDVRNNNGGHLAEVTKIISLFLKKDRVIYQLQKDQKTTKYYSHGKEDKEYPIVFLTNEATASASEVLILAIKENIGAITVGKKTYGKGTVQGLVELSNGDKYKITTKRWLSPKGNWVNDTEGINPDVDVSLNADYLKNPTDENDNQLAEAIKTALKALNK